MRISLISVGTKMPTWIKEGVAEYSKRIVKTLGFSLYEVPLAHRTKSSKGPQPMQKEGKALLAKIQVYDYVVVLEVAGKRMSTMAVAERLAAFKSEGKNIVFLVGGPDGLHPQCRERADELWSLSDLTLPHPIVRLVLVEQLYRANSLLEGHPYHRG
ncbi:23S rRNA (pseudouridine(1915)-N(3))-methyltransferase RlmH [Gammaproteobacteria bacterium]|nr:23S rRNA (pseudouridine(1915)-N(3))-methyltransferase RlmH [Gammaproteobacteria bacterium]MDC0221151.1 23S rRNA (pseudouridine(1915)-N(3))-methyltransferase RlmH [Gammaproteobacteria bacterium]|tara:strand:- start:420 stop:890 length:471 start_codon:yes stop_codon:yes gene_type:complete